VGEERLHELRDILEQIIAADRVHDT
jgi:hypothetical protein